MILAQITDPHLRPRGRLAYGVIDTEAALRRAIQTLATLVPEPDCVVVTGDLTDCGLPEEYEIVRDCLAALSMPVFVIPGNHDRRGNLAAVLRPRHPYLPASGFQHYVIEDFPVRLIALDTVVPGQGGGAMCGEREAWLADRLNEGGGRASVLLMHHPPFLTGISGMDELICRTTTAFAPLVRSHPEIEQSSAATTTVRSRCGGLEPSASSRQGRPIRSRLSCGPESPTASSWNRRALPSTSGRRRPASSATPR